MATAPLTPRTFSVAGLPIDVWGMEALPEDPEGVLCFFVLHGRGADSSSVHDLAAALVRAAARAEPAPAPLLVVTFDQRNHGHRVVAPQANMSWRSSSRGGNGDALTNPFHALDMYAIQSGTATDVRLLASHLPGFLFPSASSPAPISRWGVGGVSLGGHATWIVAAHDPRFSVVVPVIGAPDFASLMEQRAAKSRVDFGPPAFPHSLARLVSTDDPCQSPKEAWTGKKVFALCGGADTLVPFVGGGTQRMVERLRNEGKAARVDLFVEEGLGHACSDIMKAKICEWMLEHVL